MSGTVPQATAVDLVQAAREMIRAKGAPNTAENLNRAMLAISAGKETTDFDSKLEEMANGGRQSRGATGQGNGSNRRGANARSRDVASEDIKSINANRPSPSTPGTTARTGGIEDRPPETARAGDSDRPVTAGRAGVGSDPLGNPVVAGLDLEGERTARPTGGGAPRVPGTKQASGSSGYTNLPLEDRPARGTAQAATPSTDVTGTPEPGQTPGFRQSLMQQGMLNADGGLNLDDPSVDGVIKSMMGAGRGFGIAGRPPISVGRPPSTQPQLSRGPDATASPMPGGPDARIVQLPQLPAPPTGLPAPAQGLPAPPVGIGAPPAGLPPPQAALPSSYGPPVPRGNPNMAQPPGTIPLQAGNQARQMGMPQSTRDNIIGNTEALIRQLRARRAG